MLCFGFLRTIKPDAPLHAELHFISSTLLLLLLLQTAIECLVSGNAYFLVYAALQGGQQDAAAAAAGVCNGASTTCDDKAVLRDEGDQQHVTALVPELAAQLAALPAQVATEVTALHERYAADCAAHAAAKQEGIQRVTQRQQVRA